MFRPRVQSCAYVRDARLTGYQWHRRMDTVLMQCVTHSAWCGALASASDAFEKRADAAVTLAWRGTLTFDDTRYGYGSKTISKLGRFGARLFGGQPSDAALAQLTHGAHGAHDAHDATMPRCTLQVAHRTPCERRFGCPTRAATSSPCQPTMLKPKPDSARFSRHSSAEQMPAACARARSW